MHANLSLYCSAGEYATPTGVARLRRKILPGKFPRYGVVAPALVLALTVACAPAPSPIPLPPVIVPEVIEKSVQSAEENQIEPSAPDAPDAEAIVHAIEPKQPVVAADDLQALVEQAKRASADQAASLLLPAIAGFIELGQLATAETMIQQLQARPMTGSQRHALRLHEAQLAQALEHHPQALELLRQLEQSPEVSGETTARLLLLRADSQQALERTNAAVMTLLRRDKLLDQSARVANQRRILALLDSLDPLGLLLLRENPSDNVINGWIALSELLRTGTPEEQMSGIERWRRFYRDHPAEQLLLEQTLQAGESIRYRHIAMLLPLTSPFGKAARAFYEGFMASRSHDHSPHRPAISLHDIGEAESLVSLYYQAALNDGADFLVGPLGHRAVNALLAGSPLELPALMIGDIPGDKTAPNLYGISLSPELEAGQVADRAFADGHRQAGIFRSDSQSGQRLADAFAQQWEALGGTVVDNKSFPRDVSAHPQIIQEFLGLNRSIRRQRILTARLGIDLEFTPRRRDDIDFLFLAANAGQARLLAPQLRFFQAHDLPLYATSHVYTGKPNPAADADLDGIIFGDMDWILEVAVLPEPEAKPAVEAQTGVQHEPLSEAEKPAATAPVRVEAAQTESARRLRERRESPYYHTDLDRLYALGLASYGLIPRLEALRNNQRQRYFGKAVDLSVKADGNVLRHLTWARFDRGLPVPLPKVTADILAPVPAQ